MYVTIAIQLQPTEQTKFTVYITTFWEFFPLEQFKRY